jgi:tricorn protease-like protein
MSMLRGDLWVVDRETAECRQLFSESIVVNSAEISPDGRWLAYLLEHSESGRE